MSDEKIQPNQEPGGEALPAKGGVNGSTPAPEPGAQNPGGDQSGQASAESEIGLTTPRMRIAGGIIHIQIPLANKDEISICGWIQFALIPWVQMQFFKAREAQIARQNKIVKPNGQFMNGLRGFLKR